MNRFFIALGKLGFTMALIVVMVVTLEIAKFYMGPWVTGLVFFGSLVSLFYVFYSESK